jgi:hypothetical protein
MWCGITGEIRIRVAKDKRHVCEIRHKEVFNVTELDAEHYVSKASEVSELPRNVARMTAEDKAEFVAYLKQSAAQSRPDELRFVDGDRE